MTLHWEFWWIICVIYVTNAHTVYVKSPPVPQRAVAPVIFIHKHGGKMSTRGQNKEASPVPPLPSGDITLTFHYYAESLHGIQE